MLTSIATVSISGTLDHKLRAIANAGFEGVEIFENDLLGFDGTPREIGTLIRELSLVCTCYQPFRDFEGLTGGLRRRVFDRIEAKFDVMAELGAPLMLVCSSLHPDALGESSRIVDDFCELGERAAKRGMKVGYEALAWGRYVYDHRQAWDIVSRVDHPNIGLILDSFHSLARKIPNDTLKDIDPQKIFLIQIADAPQMPMDYLYWSRHFRCFPGQGDFLVAAYVAATVKQGYRGPLSLEIFNDRFREWSASRIASDGLRSLLLLQDQAKIPPALLPRIPVLGIDFLEFAVQGDEAAELGAFLFGLGFRHVGNHRSKRVTLWRAGKVHVALNADDRGWALEHWKMHGTSVCAVGLRVANARAAIDRAASLNIETFTKVPAEGELAIPWIRGVGGALIYFTEPDLGAGHWSQEFHAVSSPPPDEALAFSSIDHYSQTMRIEEFLSWQLHYLSLFEVAKTPMVEVADAYGLIQTQIIESPDETLRVLLYGSPPSESLAARFIQGGKGAGVQHMSFACNDIFAAARSLKMHGVEILEVPPNYYDDLRVRFGLKPAFVEKLAASNLLYDEDEHGRCLQLYSRAFKKRFFFEIIERQGYRGFGLTNTNVRLAAQARYREMKYE